MCYATKNDRRHGTRTHKDADAAAIRWSDIRNRFIFDFMKQHGHRDETFGQYLDRKGLTARYDTLTGF